jgi:hypothetical protein
MLDGGCEAYCGGEAIISGDMYGRVVRRREEKEACGRRDLIRAPRVSNDTLVSQTVGKLDVGSSAGQGQAGQVKRGALDFSFWWEIKGAAPRMKVYAPPVLVV